MKVKKNAIEWTVFGISCLIVGGCIAVLIAMMARSGEEPPDVIVTTGVAARGSSGFRLPVEVRNIGDTTAEGVRVELVLRQGEQEVEKGELTIAFLPRRSKREAFIVFTRDPRCCSVVTGVISFEKP